MAELATLNMDMLNRGAGEKKLSVMDNVHKIKMYNANPTTREEVNPELVGKIKVTEAFTGETSYIDSNIKISILSVVKVKSGSVYVCDDFGDPIIFEDGKNKKVFFYTNEHSVYTKKTDTLGFKQAGSKPMFFTKQELEEFVRTKRLDNGKANPFWTQGKKLDGTLFNDTVIKDTVIVYGKFLDGKFKDEYFKFVPLSTSGYGVTYKAGEQVEAEEGTFLHALAEGLKKWNEVRLSNGLKSVNSVDPSQVDMVLGFRETVVREKRMFIPTFKFDGLAAYRGDNSDDLNYILDLQAQYTEQEFGVKLSPNNFRLPSLSVSNTDNVKMIEVKSTEEHKEAIVEEITAEDATMLFDPNNTDTEAELKKLNVPF